MAKKQPDRRLRRLALFVLAAALANGVYTGQFDRLPSNYDEAAAATRVITDMSLDAFGLRPYSK